jgi:hypothetical protein
MPLDQQPERPPDVIDHLLEDVYQDMEPHEYWQRHDGGTFVSNGTLKRIFGINSDGKKRLILWNVGRKIFSKPIDLSEIPDQQTSASAAALSSTQEASIVQAAVLAGIAEIAERKGGEAEELWAEPDDRPDIDDDVEMSVEALRRGGLTPVAIFMAMVALALAAGLAINHHRLEQERQEEENRRQLLDGKPEKTR